MTVTVEFDASAWDSATVEERSRWVADVEDSINSHARVVEVTL